MSTDIISMQQLTTSQYEDIGALDQYTITASSITTGAIHSGVITGINTSGIYGTNSFYTVQDEIDLPKQKKYIVAGNYQEYKFFINKKKLDSNDFVYVNDFKTLRGLKNIHGYYIGSWRNREDISDIKLAIELANIE